MSTLRLGEFFTTLIGCAIERCHEGEPKTLRIELGRLSYLTLGYAPISWVDRLRQENGIDDQAHSLLIAQLNRHLAPLVPQWLDKVQLKSMIQSTLRLFKTPYTDRHGLAQEVCHIFSLKRSDLVPHHLSEVATVAPYLKSILMGRAWKQRNTPAYPLDLCPLPPRYQAMFPIQHRQGY